MFKRSLGLPLLACLAFSACTNPHDDGPAERVATTRQLIAGGVTDPGDSNVVDIVWNASSFTAYCSGSLLAPNMVLTARHCVAPILPAGSTSVSCGVTSFGPADSPANFHVSTVETLSFTDAAANDFHTVTEVVVPTPWCTSELCGGDIVILILSDDIQPSEAVPLVPRLDVPVAAGEAYTAIGFGITSGTASDNGTRRKLSGLNVECVGSGCTATYGSQIDTVHEWGGDTGTCEGDSGSPALDGNGQVIGVDSRGGAGCGTPIYGDVRSHAGWIRQTALHAASVGGYAPPSWVVADDAGASDAGEDAGAGDDGGASCPVPDAGEDASAVGSNDAGADASPDASVSGDASSDAASPQDASTPPLADASPEDASTPPLADASPEDASTPPLDDASPEDASPDAGTVAASQGSGCSCALVGEDPTSGPAPASRLLLGVALFVAYGARRRSRRRAA